MQKIIHADCLSSMKDMQDNSIDCILTDPPYGLSFMGKEWDKGVPGEDVWKEALRVVKPGSMMIAFGGTRTYHRLACAIEDAGWEIRDCMMWIYGSGFPKSLDVSKAIDKAKGENRELVTRKRVDGREATGIAATNFVSGCETTTMCYSYEAQTKLAKQFSGYGTSLKPAYEPMLVCMKPLDGNFAKNAEKWEVSGINIDECRIAFKDNNIGRWPANVIFDEEAASLLDEQSGILKSGKGDKHSKTQSGGYQGGFGVMRGVVYKANSGGASRFFYCAKASQSERGEGNIHPTVKPIKLLEYLLKLIMPPRENAVVLDPFCGSGSTLIAAHNLNYNAIGIELNKDYCDIAESRIGDKLKQLQIDFRRNTQLIMM